MPQNIVQTWRTAPLPYFLITGNAIVLQKVSIWDMKNLKTFPNTLSSDGKYFVFIETIQRNKFRWSYLENKKLWRDFLLHFWNLVKILNIFKKKMTRIADVFPKLWTPKNMIMSMPKKSHFRASVEKQHAKCAQTFFKLEGHPL